MLDSLLLGQIWSENIECREPERVSPLSRLLEVLLSVPVVTLVSKQGSARPIAMMESTELLPGAALGDILAEELDVDVPLGAVVLVEPRELADARDFSGADLGEHLGNVMMDIAHCLSMPIGEYEARLAELGRELDMTRLAGQSGALSAQGGLRLQ